MKEATSDGTGTVGDVEDITGRPHGEIIGDVAIGGIVNQGSDAACSDIDGRRIGGAVDDKEVDIGTASRFTGAGLDQELECGGCPSGLGKGLPD